MNKFKFITTTDIEVSSKLEDAGFIFIGEVNKVWTFINNSSIEFPNDIDKDKVLYTNVLYG